MLKTFRISYSLKNTYRVNSIIFALKQIPLIKKLLPYDLYTSRGLKIFANIVSALWEIFATFSGKALYFFLMIAPAAGLLLPEGVMAPDEIVMHLMLFLTVIGCMLNTYMFDPKPDKYYAIILLGMDAKGYTLVNYFYAIIRVVLGFLLCTLVFGAISGMSMGICLLIPFFVASAKLCSAAIELIHYNKNGHIKNENKIGTAVWISVVVLLALAYGLPAVGFTMPMYISAVLMCVTTAGSFFAVYIINSFKHYRALYKELLTQSLANQMDENAAIKITREQTQKGISSDTTITSSKEGFEYLNDLFVKRHKKLLWRSSKIITYICIGVFLIINSLFFFFEEARVAVNAVLMNGLPIFLFVMYAINRGTSITQALFINCDHSLLTYSFYKRPKMIVKLFIIRLREIIKVNILPACVIGIGLAVTLFASGGTDNVINYAVLLCSIPAMSVFFSVHYLTIYYLLQPYNAGTELKSGTYKLLTWATYYVCYVLMQVELPTLVFGLFTIVFCILYCIVASVLVFKFAPKTFRIRN